MNNVTRNTRYLKPNTISPGFPSSNHIFYPRDWNLQSSLPEEIHSSTVTYYVFFLQVSTNGNPPYSILLFSAHCHSLHLVPFLFSLHPLWAPCAFNPYSWEWISPMIFFSVSIYSDMPSPMGLTR